MWKKLGSKTVYKNNWIEVIEDKVIQPDGKPGIFGYTKVLPGVAVLPIDKHGNVYLLEEYHYPTKTKLIKPVSGGRNKKESAITAAKRELKEELGITAKQWKHLGSTNAYTSSVDAHADLFLARDLAFSKSKPEGNESLEPIKLKFNKAINMVLKGKITNGNTCIILLKAQSFLK